MSQSVDPAPTASPEPLWRARNFRTMWTGQALSQLGEEIPRLALPVLAVLLLNATEFEVGVLNAASLIAFLVVGLPAGAWIDRLRKRRVMIAADIIRAAALLVLPALWLTGGLQMWQVYLVALVLGVATVFFDVAYQSIVPSLVRTDQIAEANAKLESTQQLSGIAGPAIAGWLIGVLSAPLALLTTALTYASSIVALLLTTDAEPRRAASDHALLHREVAEGLGWVFGNPLLRRIVATTAVSNLSSVLVFTLLPLFYLRVLGFTPETMGLVLSLSAAGGLLAAVTAPRITRAVGEARAIPLSAIIFSLATLALPLAVALPSGWVLPALVAQGLVGNFAVLLYNITQVSFRQRITPARLLGRMNASIRFVVWGIMPPAALLAGWLGETIGVVPTLWWGAGFGLLAILPVGLGPFWRLRALPPPEPEATGSVTA